MGRTALVGAQQSAWNSVLRSSNAQVVVQVGRGAVPRTGAGSRGSGGTASLSAHLGFVRPRHEVDTCALREDKRSWDVPHRQRPAVERRSK